MWAKLLNHQNGPEPKFKGLGYFTNTVFSLVFKVTFTTYMGQITNADNDVFDKGYMHIVFMDDCSMDNASMDEGLTMDALLNDGTSVLKCLTN